jgi:hypothetical protein
VTVQVFTEPPVIVPKLTLFVDITVMPIASAGEPVVVNVVPEHDVVGKFTGAAALQCVVELLSQVPDPFTHHLSAI